MQNKDLIIKTDFTGLTDITVYKTGRELKSIRLMVEEFDELIKQIKEGY